MRLPNTTLEQWAVLASVVDTGGFAHAAKALHRSQSAVSYAVARLQESVGIALLKVDGRKAVLTDHGRTLLARARCLLKELSTLEALAASLKRGWEAELRLVVDAAFPRPRLLKIVAELQASCPATQIQLADVVLSGAEEAIAENSADVVVTSHVPPGYLGDRLLEVAFIAAARPDHPLFALQRELTADDLAQHVQTVVRDSGSRKPRDEGWLGSRKRFTVSSMEASLATLLAGLSYAWLPEHLLDEHFTSDALQRLPLQSGGVRQVSLYIVLGNLEPAGPATLAALDLFKR